MSLADRRLHRSYLYASAERPEHCRKAWASTADAVIFDLEDAVAPANKQVARASLVVLLDELRSRPVGSLHVRVNRGPDGHYDHDDVVAAVADGVDGLRLPKAESADALREVVGWIDAAAADAGVDPAAIGLYPTIESVAGLTAIDAIAGADRVARIAFGSTDFLADMALLAPDDEQLATVAARSAIVIASRSAEIGPPIDSVHTAIDDVAGLEAGARWARSLGFFGKSIVHPCQIEAVHRVFTPTEAEIEAARRTVEAHQLNDAAGRGASAEAGAFVDAAVAARARNLVALAQHFEESS